MSVPSIEKPAHVDDRRMRHISDVDLFATLDLSPSGLSAVRAAVTAATAGAEWAGAYAAWSAHFAARQKPVPVMNGDGYAGLPDNLRQARGGPVQEAARQIAQTPVDFTGHSHGRTPLYGLHYLNWLQPLLLAYALDRDEAHIRAFVQLFNQWYECRDQVVGEIETLDVIWYTLGLAARSLIFASAYSAFRHSPLLDVQTQARLLKSLLGASRWLAEEHDRFRYGNWQVIGVTSLYEMGIFWPEFREAQAWRDSAWQRIKEHLELDIYADGGHSERAPSYHQHVLACLARVASVAELNGQPPLQDQPRFHAMYRWLLDQTTPLGCATNFNDSGVIWAGSWAVSGAVLFDDPELKWLAGHFGTSAEIAWTLAGLPNRPGGQTAAQVYQRLGSRPPQLESKLLDTSKFGLMRTGLEPDDLYMAINYGPLVGHEYESHSHLDALSFICVGHGLPLAMEAGLPLTSYDDPLYQSWIRRARAHNMLLVDRADPDENNKEGELLFWSTSATADVFEAEHRGYQARGVRHRRAIVFVKGEYWIVYDELLLSGSHRFDWLLYCPQPFTVEAGRLQPIAGPGLVVLPVLPADGHRFEAVQGLMAVPGPRAFAGQTDFRDVQGIDHIQETGLPRATYLHVLYPVQGAAQSAALGAGPLPCQQGAGEACLIENEHGPDLFFIRDTHSDAPLAAAPAQVQNCRTDARIAWLRSREHWAVYEASFLQVRETPVFKSSSRLHALSLSPDATGWIGQAETLQQTELSLQVDGVVAEITLNRVRLPPPSRPGQEVRLSMLSRGRYTFRIVRAVAAGYN